MQAGLGYLSDDDGSIVKYDCRILTVNGANNYNVSGPLICNCLSHVRN